MKLKRVTITVVIAVLVWSSSFVVCNAGRGGRHWRPISPSLITNKSKNAAKPRNNKSSPSSKPKYSKTPCQSTFNVLKFGAKGDATSDDTKAFEAAWAAACKVEASTIIVPSGSRFPVGPISFSGPYCKPNIVFQLDGTIVAPTSLKEWGSNLLWWIEFTKLKGITIQGTGTIDGRGSIWWHDTLYNTTVDSETQLLIPFNDTVLGRPPMHR